MDVKLEVQRERIEHSETWIGYEVQTKESGQREFQICPQRKRIGIKSTQRILSEDRNKFRVQEETE